MIKYFQGDRVKVRKITQVFATVIVEFTNDGNSYCVIKPDGELTHFEVVEASVLTPASVAEVVRKLNPATLAPSSKATYRTKKDREKFPNCPKKGWSVNQREVAEQAASKLTKANLKKSRPMDRTACRAYLCPDCGGYHLTSQPWSTYFAGLNAAAE